MKAVIYPSRLSGTWNAIPSKSHLCRLLTAAFLSGDATVAAGEALSDDITAFIGCLESLGAAISVGDGFIRVRRDGRPEPPSLFAGESASAARFLIPVASALYDGFYIDASPSLRARPLTGLLEAMSENGVSFSSGSLPFYASGRLRSGTFTPGSDITSQYISGLLFALPLCYGDSEIRFGTAVSSPYLDMTLSVLSGFGISYRRTRDGIRVPGNQKYIAPSGRLTTEGDWSAGACFYTANALGADITINGLPEKTLQGDSAIKSIIPMYNTENPSVHLDISDTPDLVFILSALACAHSKETVISGCSRLRYKESDRAANAAELINALGGDALHDGDSIIIRGTGKLKGGYVPSYNDHRAVMAAAIASCVCDNPVTVDGAEAVNKSYPSFFGDLSALSAKVTLL